MHVGKRFQVSAALQAALTAGHVQADRGPAAHQTLQQRRVSPPSNLDSTSGHHRHNRHHVEETPKRGVY